MRTKPSRDGRNEGGGGNRHPKYLKFPMIVILTINLLKLYSFIEISVVFCNRNVLIEINVVFYDFVIFFYLHIHSLFKS